jgi:hypothetical protein
VRPCETLDRAEAIWPVVEIAPPVFRVSRRNTVIVDVDSDRVDDTVTRILVIKGDRSSSIRDAPIEVEVCAGTERIAMTV